LGVRLEAMSPELARQARLPSITGVYIADIYLIDNKSPAADAGIHPGDVLLQWNGTSVNSPADLRGLVEKTPISSRAKVVVNRGGQELSLEVVVGDRPQLD
jgi:serine protease Do